MAAIFGQCPLCPDKSRPQRLFGGYCGFHIKSSDEQKQKAIEKRKKEMKKALKK